MSYEWNQQDVFDLSDTLTAEKKIIADELFFKYCPYCNGGQNRDKNTFSINLKTGTFHCFRSSCGKTIGLM